MNGNTGIAVQPNLGIRSNRKLLSATKPSKSNQALTVRVPQGSAKYQVDKKKPESLRHMHSHCDKRKECGKTSKQKLD